MTHNALKSLWGDGPKESYSEEKRKNTAKSMISPGERPQDIRTPADLVEAVADLFGGAILLDACDTLQQTKACKHYTGAVGSDGLVETWEDGTYCNPPYKDLKAWLDKALREARLGKKIVVLCPVRPHRKWFRQAMREGRVVYMNPLKFDGYTQAFPAPLCLLIFNVSEVRDTFSKWGETCQ